MRDLSWKFFEQTGNVDAYLLYKEATTIDQTLDMENDDSEEHEPALESEESSP